MSKRFPTLQTKLQISKKPKLDITINFGRSSTTKSLSPAPAPRSLTEDIFGDEDDEDCLLASQSVDIEMLERCTQQILIDQEPSAELSFNKFSRNVVTSTQVYKNVAASDLLEDDEDDAFDNIETNFRNGCNTQMQDAQWNDDPFKVPRPMKTNPKPSRSVLPEQPTKSNKNNDNDRVNHFMRKAETYKKEIDKLTKAATEFNEKMQIKDGEVSLLRSELLHLKQLNETLRLQKMQENDNVKKEWREKVSELEKKLKVQITQLDFKNVEMVNIRSKQLNESQRLLDDSVDFIQPDFTITDIFNNLHLRITSSADDTKFKIPLEIFEKTLILDRNSSFQDASFRRELDKIQSLLSQIHITQAEVPAIQCISKRIIESAKVAVVGLLKYIERLEFTKYNDTNAAVEYEFLCQAIVDSPTCEMHPKRNINVYQEARLFAYEKGHIVRRILGGLAIACRYSNEICDSLVTERIGLSSLLEVIIEAIELLSFSKELYSHFGLLESLGTLLNSFIRNIAENKNLIATISRYLKAMIFCRPDIRPLVEISIFLNYVSTNWTDRSLLNSLCTNSAVGSFIVDEYYKIFQFSSESCPLQVYGVLLEVALPQGKILNQSQIDCLSQITYHHIRFLRNCFEKQIDWIADARNNSGTCDCYIKIANSFIVLFHLFLKHWIDDPRCFVIKIVSKISRIGVLLLWDIFCKNYRPDLLQNGGSTIKNRLHIIHDWLRENRRILRFKIAHCNALQAIKLSHIIANPIHYINEEPSENSSHTGNEIWSEVFENFI